MDIYKKYGLFILSLILFVFIFWFAFPILNNMFIFDFDDLNSTLDPYPFIREENGRYICHIISRIICVYIPNLLGIHLQNAINTIGMFAYILILFLLFTVTAKFYYLKDKDSLIYAFVFLYAALLFFSYMSPENYFYSLIISFQYGYVLAAVFSILFLYIVYRYLIIKQTGKFSFKYSLKRIIIYGIIAFCAGNSTQIATYSLFVMLVLFALLTLLQNKFNLKKTKNVLFNKNTILVINAYFLGFLCMVCCPGFWNEVAWRHTSSVHQVFTDFIPFIKDWYVVVIQNNISFYVTIGFLMLLNIIRDYSLGKKADYVIYNNLLKIIPILGVWAYYFTLILGGRTFGGSNISFWLIEPFYNFYILMIFAVVISMFVGEFFRRNSFYNKIYIISFIFLIYFIYHWNIQPPIFEKRNEFKEFLAEERRLHYDVEKAMLLSLYKNEPIILPAEKRQNVSILFVWDRYLKSVYGIKKDNLVIIESDYPSTMDHFYLLGGTITEDERNKADFQKLLNKDFVLNNIEPEQ